MAAINPRQSRFLSLLAISVAIVAIWQLPYGEYLLYPFTILATWCHELGHGLTALALGGRIESLRLFADGSGLATHGGAGGGALGRALVAAGGPLGPPIAGALFILASRRPRAARFCLVALGVTLLGSGVLWIRSLFGLAAVAVLGGAVLVMSQGSPGTSQTVGVQVLGAQACLSSFRQLGYLFTHHVVIAGRPMLSDSGQIAESLFLPYWFWGGLMAAVAVVILVASLRAAAR